MKFLIKCIKGIFIGIANAIPGVSGGTMMVSMGIYDDIILSINHLFRQFKKSIITLLPYMTGMALGIVGLSFCIEYFMRHYPLQTAFIFIGLILGCVPDIFGNVKQTKIEFGSIVLFLVFFAGIIGMQFLGEGSEVSLTFSFTNVIILFFVGLIASATMIIPGVSGSMVLLILGFYNPVIRTIKDFFTALVKWDMPIIINCLGVIIPMGIGIVVGIIAISKLIEILLKNYKGYTYSSILGLVVASPIIVLLSMEKVPVLNAITVITTIITFAVGLIITKILGGE